MLKQAVALAAILIAGASPAGAQSPFLDLAAGKPVMEMTKNNWVHFRHFNGKQLIYFTHFESYACIVHHVRYSINSDALDKIWSVQDCDRERPAAVTKDKIYLSLSPGTAKFMHVQAIFRDGAKSSVVCLRPPKKGSGSVLCD